MEFKLLKSFSVVANYKNFSKAAEELQYAQSTISEHIKKLENDLGVVLFERLGNQVRLTKNGETLASYAQKILNLCDEAVASVSNDPKHLISGELRIAMNETLCFYRLPNLLRDYHKKYPQVDLKIKMGYCYEFPNWIRSNLIDIGFVLDHIHPMQNIVAIKLFDEKLTLVAGKQHPIASAGLVKIQDLENEHLILTQSGSAYRALFEQYLNRVGVQAKSVTEFESIEAMKHFVLSNLGLAFLPRSTVAREIANQEMQEIIIKGLQLSIPAQVLYHQNKWMSPALQALLQMVVDSQ